MGCQVQAGELGSFLVDKREGFRGPQIEAVGVVKAIGRLILPWGP